MTIMPPLPLTRFRLSRSCFALFRGRSVSTSSRPPNKTVAYWKPAALTILVGGVTCCASGIYAVEYNLKWSRQRWDERDGLISQFKRWWRNIAPANRFAITLIGLNTTVFLLWRIPALHHSLEKYFMSSISNRSSLSILLSEFSHIEFWHLGLNMLVLWSFTPALMRTLGDSDSSVNTWPFYLTAGAFASMVGFYGKLIRRSNLSSLGASGALMAVVTLVVMNNPNSSVYLIFLPFFPIPSTYALGGVIAMDILGVLRGWQFFDHAGHLGGVIFAVLYQWWLHRVFIKMQSKSATKWLKWRNY